MYCEAHEKYTGYRRPSNGCHSCWRVYLNKKDLVLPDYIRSISSKSPDVAKYLVANQSNIMMAPVIQEATIEPSGFKFSESLEELIEDGFGEAFEGLPKEDIQEGVLPIVEEIIEEIEEALEKPKPQRGRFV